MTGFLFPLVSGTSHSQRDAEQTNGPLFPKVTSCFPTHLQRHFPSPGLAGSSSLPEGWQGQMLLLPEQLKGEAGISVPQGGEQG